jgi:hypothetical protein
MRNLLELMWQLLDYLMLSTKLPNEVRIFDLSFSDLNDKRGLPYSLKLQSSGLRKLK